MRFNPLTFEQMEVVTLFQPWLNRGGGGGAISRPDQRLTVSASMRKAVAGANGSNTWGKMIFVHELSAVDFDGR